MKHKKSKAFLSLLLMGSVIVNVQGTYPVLADGNDLETETPAITEPANGNQNLGSVETENDETLGTPQEGTPPAGTIETTDSVGDSVSGGDKDSEGGTTTDGSTTIDGETNPDDDTDSEPSEDETVTEEEQKTISEFESSSTDGKTIVSVKIENVSLPEGTVLKLEPVTDGEDDYAAIKDKLDKSDKGAAFAAYKFSFVKDGEPVQTPEGTTLKVTIKSASKINNQEVTKLVELQEDGTLETVANSDNQKLSISKDKAIATYTTDKPGTVAFVGKSVPQFGYLSGGAQAIASNQEGTEYNVKFVGTEQSFVLWNGLMDYFYYTFGTGTIKTKTNITHGGHLLPGMSYWISPWSNNDPLEDFKLVSYEFSSIKHKQNGTVYFHESQVPDHDKPYYTVRWVLVSSSWIQGYELRGVIEFNDPDKKYIQYNVAYPDVNDPSITGPFEKLERGKYELDDVVPYSSIENIRLVPNDSAAQEIIKDCDFDGWYYDPECSRSIEKTSNITWPDNATTINLYGKYVPKNWSDMSIQNKVDSYLPSDNELSFKYSLTVAGLKNNSNVKLIINGKEVSKSEDGKYYFNLKSHETATFRLSNTENQDIVVYTIEELEAVNPDGTEVLLDNFKVSNFKVSNNGISSIVSNSPNFSATFETKSRVTFTNTRELPVPAGVTDSKSTIAQTIFAGAASLGALIFLDKAKKHKKKLD